MHFFDQVLILSAAEKYDTDDYGNAWQHVTNTAFQLGHNGWSEDACVSLWGDVAAEHGAANCRAALGRMHAQTAELFAAMKAQPSTFRPLEHCFELYGLDFLIDEDFGVWFLEANPGPDFKQTGGGLKCVIERLLDESAAIVLGEGDREDDGDSWFTKVFSESWVNK